MHEETRALLDQLADSDAAFHWAEQRRVAKDREFARYASGDQPFVTVSVEECFDSNRERITKEVARLNKIGAKYGQGRVSVEFSPTYWVREVEEEVKRDGEWVRRRRKVAMRAMVICSPSVLGQDDWTVLGVKILLGSEVIVQTLPGATVPPIFYSREDTGCDHCKTSRRRNELVIVHNPKLSDGGWRQVGKQCLLEYTGIGPDYALLKAAFHTSKPWLSVDGVRYEEDLIPWLRWVAVAVRLDGRYISQATADRENERFWGTPAQRIQTTVNHAHTLKNRAAYDRKQAEQDGEVPTPADDAVVERVMAYVASLDPHMSTYAMNLVALFRAEVLLPRLDGLAASAFAGYLREEQRVREAAERAKQQRPSEFLGEVGQKVALPKVKVERVNEFQGNYGTTHIYNFRTPEGDKVSWFSSNDMDLSLGDEVGLRGTIKKLETYRDERCTVLTRCTVL